MAIDAAAWAQAQEHQKRYWANPAATELEIAAATVTMMGVLMIPAADGTVETVTIPKARREWTARQLRAAAVRLRAGVTHRHRGANIGHARSRLNSGRPRRRIASRRGAPPGGSDDPGPHRPACGWRTPLDLIAFLSRKRHGPSPEGQAVEVSAMANGETNLSAEGGSLLT